MPKLVDITGHKFNLLTVIKRSDRQIDGNVRWDCVCDCGNTAWVVGSRLRTGITKSCGCLAKSNAEGHFNPTHGMSGTPEYQAWADAKVRCLNPDDPQYGYYGGRGITMQDDWLGSFQSFFNYVGPRPSNLHSLDRMDNDLDYCEGNVRWATKLEQVANRGMNKNNKTGVTGVSFVVNPINGFKHYKAVWGPKSELIVKSFSVAKYGEDAAFKMAVKARLDGLAKLKEESVYTDKHGEQRKSK